MFTRRDYFSCLHSLCVLLAAMLFIQPSFASVTVTGSRIIYPSTASSVDVQLKNNDAFPYVIQSWFDDGDVNSQPQQKSTVPFISTPPVFRIQPRAGQIVRVMFNGKKALPDDRETVYWFNTLQIPPSNITPQGKSNAMLVMLRNRMKIFYRPVGIGRPDNILKGIRISTTYDNKKGTGITVSNPQPWYASLTEITLQSAGHVIRQPAAMISPFSSQTFWFSGQNKNKTGQSTASVMAINDQGARISENYSIALP